MLQVKVQGQTIDLPEDFAVTMNLKSPIFSELGSSSYPFRFKSTPRNKKILNFLNRLENTSNPYREYSCEIFWNELVIFIGILKCRIANDDSYEGQIYEGRGDFFYSMKNKSLQNYSFGEMEFDTETRGINYANSCLQLNYPDTPIAFPQIYNDAYFEEKPENVNLWIYNKYFAQSHIYTEPGLYILDEFAARMIIVPCLYLKYVIKILFTQMGYSINRNFFDSHEDFNKIVLYNSVNANEDPSIPYFKENLSHLYFDYHLPRLSISEFIKGYESFFGVRTFINQLTKSIDIISLDNIIQDSTFKDFSKNLLSFSTELEDKIQGFHLKMELDSGDGAFQNMITLEEEPLLASIKDPVETVADLPPWPSSAFGESRFVIDKDLYYVLNGSGVWIPSFNFDSWGLYTEFIYKQNDKSISSKFSTMFMDTGWDVICTNKMIDWKDVAPRIIFANYVYTLGNSFVSGQNLTDNYLLYYTGENGIFEKFYKNFLTWQIKSKNVKFKKQMDIIELCQFDFTKKRMINGTKYLFKDLQVTLKKNSIQPATLNGLVCY